MVKDNLLEEVIADRLAKAIDSNLTPEEQEKAFKDAMEAMSKLSDTEKETVDKRDKVLGWVFRGAEIIAVPLVMLGVDYAFKWKLTKEVMHFEQHDTFTSTPGRGFIGSIFRFRK